MTPLKKLWDLRDDVKYWDNRFESSNPSDAREIMSKLNKAKDELKSHKLKYFPELLQQPIREYIAYEMLADKFEVYENLND